MIELGVWWHCWMILDFIDLLPHNHLVHGVMIYVVEDSWAWDVMSWIHYFEHLDPKCHPLSMQWDVSMTNMKWTRWWLLTYYILKRNSLLKSIVMLRWRRWRNVLFQGVSGWFGSSHRIIVRLRWNYGEQPRERRYWWNESHFLWMISRWSMRMIWFSQIQRASFMKSNMSQSVWIRDCWNRRDIRGLRWWSTVKSAMKYESKSDCGTRRTLSRASCRLIDQM